MTDLLEKRVMIESPLIQELISTTGHKYILNVLKTRFETVPEELADELRTIFDELELEDLNRYAVVCPDLDVSRTRMHARRNSASDES